MMRRASRLIFAKASGSSYSNRIASSVSTFCEAEYGRDNVLPLIEFGAGGAGDVEVAGGINHDVAADRLAAQLGLADDALDDAVLNDSVAKQAVETKVDVVLADEIQRHAFPGIGIKAVA